jgi:hypothetical protein
MPARRIRKPTPFRWNVVALAAALGVELPAEPQ